MDYEFRIGSAAEFVQIHADALAVSIHAESDDAIEQPEEQIDERQNHTKQGSDADELGEKLSRASSEDAGGCQSPKAGNGVRGNSAGWVVDGDCEFEEFNQKRSEDAGNDSDEESR